MAAPKGHPRYGGRKKGVVNKSTQDLRSIFVLALEDNKDKLQDWFDRTAKRNPGKALEIYLRIGEMLLPKPVETSDVKNSSEFYAKLAEGMMTVKKGA